jgi:hypothetical protein
MKKREPLLMRLEELHSAYHDLNLLSFAMRHRPEKSADYGELRRMALKLKARAQALAGAARAVEVRTCEHVPEGEPWPVVLVIAASMTSDPPRPQAQKVTTHIWSCAKCGKSRIKVVEMQRETYNEETGEFEVNS